VNAKTIHIQQRSKRSPFLFGLPPPFRIFEDFKRDKIGWL